MRALNVTHNVAFFSVFISICKTIFNMTDDKKQDVYPWFPIKCHFGILNFKDATL